MKQTFLAILFLGFGVALFVSMLLLLEYGRQFGVEQLAQYGDASRSGVGIVDNAVFALLALLIGFAFSGAVTRFNDRRQLIVAEVNAMSTAWQRISCLPDDLQAPIRDGFRHYLNAVVAVHERTPLTKEERRELATVARAQEEVWQKAVEACVDPNGETARMLLLPSLNEMFDAVDKAYLMRRIHSPFIVFAMIVATAFAAAVFAAAGAVGGG